MNIDVFVVKYRGVTKQRVLVRPKPPMESAECVLGMGTESTQRERAEKINAEPDPFLTRIRCKTLAVVELTSFIAGVETSAALRRAVANQRSFSQTESRSKRGLSVFTLTLISSRKERTA